jgi:hypothetical protein
MGELTGINIQQQQRQQMLSPMYQENAAKIQLINQLKSDLNQNLMGLSTPTQSILMNSF